MSTRTTPRGLASSRDRFQRRATEVRRRPLRVWAWAAGVVAVAALCHHVIEVPPRLLAKRGALAQISTQAWGNRSRR